MLFRSGHRVHHAVVQRMCEALRCQSQDFGDKIALLKPTLRDKAQSILKATASATRTGHPTCPNCRYDLRALVGHRCPECGTVIPLEILQRIEQIQRFKITAAADPVDELIKPKHKTFEHETARRQTESDLARALTLSSEFVKEIARDRRSHH